MTASDTLWAIAGVGAVLVGGYAVYTLTQQRDNRQTTTVSNQTPLVAAGATAAAATQAGGLSGYNYIISPSAYSTSPKDILDLASATQGVISAGLGSILTPVLAPVNALGEWVRGLI